MIPPSSIGATIRYRLDAGGRTVVELERPAAPASPPPPAPWTPVAGRDTRDLRDPQKVGRAIARRRRKR